jgi:Leucine-rich repeat (LRR) protein
MSHPNPTSYQYELVDADATILDPDATIGHNDDRPMPSANASPNHHQIQPPPSPPPLSHPPPHPTLPTGQIIDGKNTLQSFDRFVRNDVAVITTKNARTGEDKTGTTRAAALATTHDTTHPIAARTFTTATTRPPDPPLYTLPNGEIINAKNINQSYDAMAQRNDNYNGNNNNKNGVTPPTNLGTENVIISNSNNPSDTAVPLRVTTTNNTDQDHGSGSHNNDNNNNVPTVQAYAVESQIVVDAEPISMLLQPQPHPTLQQPPLQQKRSLTFWIINTLVITTLVAAASLGVYCGTGNCKSNSGGTASTPTTAAAAAIKVACDFLELSTVNGACQATTSSFGSRTDTTIPREIGLLTQLTYLRLSINTLTGTIPPELASLTQLTELYLFNNALMGSIPSELASLTQLTSLSLSFNALTGTIPSELASLTQLKYLYLYDNALTGTIPSELASLTQLTVLFLNSNALMGSIPSKLASLTQLAYLFLDGNALTGAIPSELARLAQLTALDLSDSKLTGTIPASLCAITSLGIYIDCGEITCTCCVDSLGTSCG